MWGLSKKAKTQICKTMLFDAIEAKDEKETWNMLECLESLVGSDEAAKFYNTIKR
ncbi:hypothetical protein Pan216_20760 [Planctomycetes bacterium Pan216]|uniref:Uncharacterized protein n=1 Tax=Kolteria novifilia TaxID=2527975 RepID=A0A518B2Q5_9BACT|nr:hypothetical protein Pan216_20760 [Planctomycetes bacterium Pan216]